MKELEDKVLESNGNIEEQTKIIKPITFNPFRFMDEKEKEQFDLKFRSPQEVDVEESKSINDSVESKMETNKDKQSVKIEIKNVAENEMTKVRISGENGEKKAINPFVFEGTDEYDQLMKDEMQINNSSEKYPRENATQSSVSTEEKKKGQPVLTFGSPSEINTYLQENGDIKDTTENKKEIINSGNKKNPRGSVICNDANTREDTVKQKVQLPNAAMIDKIIQDEKKASKEIGMISQPSNIQPTETGYCSGISNTFNVNGSAGSIQQFQNGNTYSLNNIANYEQEWRMRTLYNFRPQFDLATYDLVTYFRYDYLDENNQIMERQFKVLIVTEDMRNNDDIVINEKEIPRLVETLRSKNIFLTLRKNTKTDAYNMEQRMLESAKICGMCLIYKTFGWHEVGGKWWYLYDGYGWNNGIVVQSGYTLETVQQDVNHSREKCKYAIDNLLKLNNRQETTSLLFLTVFMGVAFKLFESAGYPIRFLMFLTGTTGTLKTETARAIYKQVYRTDDKNESLSSFYDTRAALGEIIAEGVDRITIIDDYCPTKSAKDAKEQIEKLEMIIRYVGDGRIKSKMNQELKLNRSKVIRGFVVVTGEMEGSGYSSNLRCLYCKIERGTMDGKVLANFQKDKTLIGNLIQNFSNFLSNNWNAYVSEIQNQFNYWRQEFSGLVKEKRTIDQIVILYIVKNFVVRFMSVALGYSDDNIKRIDKLLMDGMCAAIDENQEHLVDVTPAQKYLEYIGYLIAKKQIKIAASKSDYEAKIKEYLGYSCGTDLYLDPISIYGLYVKQLKQINESPEFSKNNINKLMYEDGFIKKYKNGKGTTYEKKVKIEGRMMKFLVIDKKYVCAKEEF